MRSASELFGARSPPAVWEKQSVVGESDWCTEGSTNEGWRKKGLGYSSPQLWSSLRITSIFLVVQLAETTNSPFCCRNVSSPLLGSTPGAFQLH